MGMSISDTSVKVKDLFPALKAANLFRAGGTKQSWKGMDKMPKPELTKNMKPVTRHVSLFGHSHTPSDDYVVEVNELQKLWDNTIKPAGGGRDFEQFERRLAAALSFTVGAVPEAVDARKKLLRLTDDLEVARRAFIRTGSVEHDEKTEQEQIARQRVAELINRVGAIRTNIALVMAGDPNENLLGLREEIVFTVAFAKKTVVTEVPVAVELKRWLLDHARSLFNQIIARPEVRVREGRTIEPIMHEPSELKMMPSRPDAFAGAEFRVESTEKRVPSVSDYEDVDWRAETHLVHRCWLDFDFKASLENKLRRADGLRDRIRKVLDVDSKFPELTQRKEEMRSILIALNALFPEGKPVKAEELVAMTPARFSIQDAKSSISLPRYLSYEITGHTQKFCWRDDPEMKFCLTLTSEADANAIEAIARKNQPELFEIKTRIETRIKAI